jgi:nuclear transport factor 2 (NTF2) superfamily protein
METHAPLPPFTLESAIQKVRLAEDGWNTRDAAKVATAYTLDTKWRNRATFVCNREEAEAELLPDSWTDFRAI